MTSDASSLLICSTCQRVRLASSFTKKANGETYHTCEPCRAKDKRRRAITPATAQAKAIRAKRDALLVSLMSINSLAVLDQAAQAIASLPSGTACTMAAAGPAPGAIPAILPQIVGPQA